MKSSLRKISAVILVTMFLFVSFSMNVLAEDGVVRITLEVENGSDIVDAFNAATRQAKDDTSGTLYEITIPAGSYTSNSQLKIWNNTTVLMNDVTITHTSSSTTMLRHGNKSDWDAANDGKGYGGYTGGGNIKFVGGTLDGGGFNQACMRFGHMSGITLQDMTFKNVKNVHHVEIGACENITIENCTFSDFTGNWSAKLNYEALQFDVTAGNHFGAYNPLNDDTPCRNVVVKNCTFKNLERGIGTHTGSANTYCNNIRFLNNTFTNITGYAIMATNYTNAVIDGNVISNCGAGIFFRTMDGSHKNFYSSITKSSARTAYCKLNSRITNNTITVTNGYQANFANVAYGIQLYGEKLEKQKNHAPKGDWRIAGVTVTGNTIRLNVTGYALWLQGAVENTISGNAVTLNIAKKGTGGTGDGLRAVKCVKNTISNNTISNDTAKGGYDGNVIGINLLDSSNSNTVSGNKISRSKKDGIKVDSSSSNKIKANTITSAGRDGVHLSSANNTNLNANAISKAKRDGLNIASSKKIVITSNKFTSNKRYGINASKKMIKKDAKNKFKKNGKKPRSWK